MSSLTVLLAGVTLIGVLVIGAVTVHRRRPLPTMAGTSVCTEQAFFDHEFKLIASRLDATSGDLPSISDLASDSGEEQAGTERERIKEAVRAFGGSAGFLRDVRPTAVPGTVRIVSTAGELHLRIQDPGDLRKVLDLATHGATEETGPTCYTLTLQQRHAKMLITTPRSQISLHGEILAA